MSPVESKRTNQFESIAEDPDNEIISPLDYHRNGMQENIKIIHKPFNSRKKLPKGNSKLQSMESSFVFETMSKGNTGSDIEGSGMDKE